MHPRSSSPHQSQHLHRSTFLPLLRRSLRPPWKLANNSFIRCPKVFVISSILWCICPAHFPSLALVEGLVQKLVHPLMVCSRSLLLEHLVLLLLIRYRCFLLWGRFGSFLLCLQITGVGGICRCHCFEASCSAGVCAGWLSSEG